MKRLLSALLCAMMIVGCSEDVTTEETTGNIVGSVVDKSTGEPVPVVSVKLTENGKTTITGSDGVFEFKDVEPGKYTVKANKEGYNPGENTVSVASGGNSECHILIERIPAVITADRNELDFGSNYSTNTMSFNIVNNNYQTLGWKIVNNCGWIDKVEPASGELEYGKTGTIIVKIDRDALADGVNEAILVLSTTGNGSTEVKVKATGQAQRLATLNTLKMGDITASTAVFNGEIVDVGYPEYTERGFVYSEQQQPNENNTIQLLTSTVTKDATFSQQAVGLTLGKTYYVRAYARNNVGIAYSTNQVSFTTSAVSGKVDMVNIDDINLSTHTAVAHAKVTNVGDPAYSERGFVYSNVNTTPTIYNSIVKVDGSGLGTFDAQLTELERESTYYVRAYIKNEAGITYSEQTTSFTTEESLATVTTLEATDIDRTTLSAVLHGNITFAGNPAYTERGFVYSTEYTTPTINDSKVVVEGLSLGDFEARVTGFSNTKVTYVRAYVTNSKGTAYGDSVSFSTAPVAGTVEMEKITDINLSAHTAMAHAKVTKDGEPAFSQCGFVYSSTNAEPTMYDKVITLKAGAKSYDAQLTDLLRETTYYVRAFIKNDTVVTYSSNTVSFKTTESLPSVTTLEATDEDRATHSAVLHGNITFVGDPTYTERGFVYSTEYENPTVNDSKVVVSGTGMGEFEARVSGLSGEYKTYVRAYATNSKGTAYGETVTVLEPDFVVLKSAGIAVQKTDIGSGYYTSMSDLCKNSIEGGFADWRLPTIEELATLYNLKSTIGGFRSAVYWSSSMRSSYYYGDQYYCIYFVNGSQSLYYPSEEYHYARCVRTLTAGGSNTATNSAK